MRPGTDAGVPHVDLVGIGFQMGHELPEIVHRQVLVDDQQIWIARQQRDRREVRHQVVGQRIDRAVGGVGAEVPADDGVAVRRGARDAGGADCAARARYIFHHQRLAERDAHPFAEVADDGVGRTAGRERHDHGDRPVRIVLRRRTGETEQCERDGKQRSHATPLMGYSALMPAALMIGCHFSISALW